MTLFEQCINSLSQHGGIILIVALTLFSGVVICSVCNHSKERKRKEQFFSAFKQEKEHIAGLLADELLIRKVSDTDTWVRGKWNDHCKGTAFHTMMSDRQVGEIVKRAYEINGTYVID